MCQEVALDRYSVSLVAVFVGVVGAVAAMPSIMKNFGPPTVADAMRNSDPKIRKAIFDLVQPVALANCDLKRFGEANDGGYLMCANLLEGVESGYSYGISGYDQWGCDVSTKLSVPVHQYDC